MLYNVQFIFILSDILWAGSIILYGEVATHCKKNPDKKPAPAGLHRTTRIEPDFFPVDSHPDITGNKSGHIRMVKKIAYYIVSGFLDISGKFGWIKIQIVLEIDPAGSG